MSTIEQRASRAVARRRLAPLMLAMALCAAGCWPSAARACGVCVEDKMAATYDHAVLQQAMAQGRLVVYCDVDGARDIEAVGRTAAQLPGVQPASVRVSRDPEALSFALDPKVQAPEAAVADLARRLRGQGEVRLLRTLPDRQAGGGRTAPGGADAVHPANRPL